MKPLSIDKVLQNALQQVGIKEKIEEYRAVVHWYKVASNLALRTEPAGIGHGRLFVNVTDSVTLHQLTFYKKQYIDKINLMMGKNIVKDIVFRIGNINKKEQDSESKEEYSRRLNCVQLDQDELTKIDEIVSQIEDEELQDLLRNLFIKQTKFYKMDPSNLDKSV